MLSASGVVAVRLLTDWNHRMSDENETNATPEDQPEGQPESQPEGEQPEQADDAQPDGEQVNAEDIVGDDADMTPEEAETLAAAMAAINGMNGDDSASEPEPEPEMTSDEAETLAAAMAAINQVQGVADSVAPPVADAKPFEAPAFDSGAKSAPKEGMELLSDVHMNVRIELGRTKMFVEDVLKLSDGAVVELDKLAGDAVDVFVNDRKVAKGEVLVLNDLFCVRISEIVDISAVDD